MQLSLVNLAACSTLLLSAEVSAQSLQDLQSMYESTCSQVQVAQMPQIRLQCDQVRSTINQLRKQQTSTPMSPPSAISSAKDGTTQCACARKLGRCRATARVISQDVLRTATGLSSRVVVRTEPPPGQCVEVTVFLQETAFFGANVNRRGLPLYQVIKGTNDVEWKNLSTSASRLEYSILEGATECYVCESRRGGMDSASSGVDALSAEKAVRAQKRASYELQYQECLAGKGQLVQALPPEQRPQFCASFKEAMENDTE